MACVLLMIAGMFPATLMAWWGPQPWFGSAPATLLRGPVLISPVNAHQIPDNHGNNINQTFRWKSRKLPPGPYGYPYLRRALPYSGYGAPVPRVDPAYLGTQYAVCIYDNVRCDQGRSGVQLFAPAGAGTNTLVTLPSRALQGRSFFWAVRECPGSMPNSPFGPGHCVWSESNQISWVAQPEPPPPPPTEGLNTPCNLTATQNTDLPTNLSFDWCSVTGADRYIICMASNAANLGQCNKDTNPQFGLYKDSSSDSDFRRFLPPPPPNTGSSGSTFLWKVTACQSQSQTCSDWSSDSSAQWP
jgi:hypothetical protein